MNGPLDALFENGEICWQSAMESVLSPLLLRMRDTPQDEAWHAEGNVLCHTRLVCGALASLPGYRALSPARRAATMLAALLHDCGKPQTTRRENGRIVSPGHGPAGSRLARRTLFSDFLLGGREDAINFRETVCALIQYHTAPVHLWENAQPERRARRLAAIGENAPDFTLEMLALLARADALGRKSADAGEYLDQISMFEDIAREAGCLCAPFAFPDDYSRRAYLSGRDIYAGQPLFDPCWGEVILMCGLPAAGKDTFIRARFPGLPVVSLDEIRAENGVSAADPQGPVAALAREAARVHLRAHRTFVWNATGLTPALREKQVSLFAAYGARTRVQYLEAPWPEILERNRARARTVPEAALFRMLGALQPPTVNEAETVLWTPSGA